MDMDNQTIQGYRLSPQQHLYWMLGSLQKATAPSVTQCALRLEGALDRERLLGSLSALVERYEILRTSFQTVPGMNVPLQVVAGSYVPSIEDHDLSVVESDQQADGIEGVMRQMRHTPFDMAGSPLLRLALVRLAADDHMLLVTLPSLLVDRHGLGALVSQLVSIYNGETGDEPLQFVDLSEAQHESLEGENADEGREYWQGILAASDQGQSLPFENDPPLATSFDQASVVFDLDTGLSARVESLARQQGVDRAGILLASWQILLGRLAGAESMTVGVEFDGRTYEEMEDAPGLFARYLPITLRVDGGIGLSELLSNLTEVRESAAARQEYFTWETVRGATSDGGSFLPYRFEWRESATLTGSDIRFSLDRLESSLDRFKILLSIEDRGDMLRLTLRYDSSLYTSELIARLVERYRLLLDALLSRPEGEIGSYGILTGEERHHLLVEFNNTDSAYQSDQPVHRMIEHHASLHPTRPALLLGEERLSYGDLNARANQLARHLRTMGAGPEGLVGICMERSIEMIVAIIGVLKSGAAYLPLDPHYPKDRLEHMLRDSGVSLLLTDRGSDEAVTDYSGKVLRLDADRETIALESDENLDDAPGLTPESLAYVIYTSGSTGLPKGAMITHGNLTHYVQAMHMRLEVSPTDRYLHTASIAFSSSVRQLMMPLVHGAMVVIALADQMGDPRELFGLIKNAGVTIIDVVPSYWRNISDAVRLLPHQQLASLLDNKLRLILSASEALLYDVPSRWTLELGHPARLVNMFGQTETTGIVSTYPIPSDYEGRSGIVPVGRPIANTRIYLLDRWMNPVPTGVPGEIYISGPGVGRGYLNRPELTEEKFVSDPFSDRPGARLYRTGDMGVYDEDGTINFLGRGDQQVKVRGFRIEPGEIESRLAEHPGVQQAVVLAQSEEGGDTRLVAYVVPDPVTAFTARQLLRMKREGELEGRSLHELPNGMVVCQMNRNETEFTYKEIFEENSYLQHGIQLSDGDCVMDIGANIGIFTLYIAGLRKDIQIYSFEPIPPIFEVLRINTELYGVNARLFNSGVAEETKSDLFTFYPRLTAFSTRYADFEQESDVARTIELNQRNRESIDSALFNELLEEQLETEMFTCTLRSISDIIAENGIERIDLLKIDAQKSELDVLNGISEEDWPKIRQIVGELHEIDNRVAEIRSLLQRHGFEVMIHQDYLQRDTALHIFTATRSDSLVEEGNATPFGTMQVGGEVETIDVPRESMIWRSPDRLSADLRSYLRERLPDYMVPSSFVLLDTLPLTVSGKLDRGALRATEEFIGVGEPKANFVQPRTPVEEILARIWSEVLKLESIGINDNFFELGGDSILSIQIIARAHQSGINITPRQFLQNPTIAGLALGAGLSPTAHAEQGVITGEVRITPILHWFFEHEFPEPQRWNQWLAFELREKIDPLLIEKAVGYVATYHDVLRSGYSRREGSWHASIAPPYESVPFSVIDLSSVPESEQKARFDEAIEAVRCTMDLAGPLWHMLLVDTGSLETSRLVVVLHGLVSGPVSWRIIVQDLQTLYQQATRGEEMKLPPKTTSFRQWSERLHEYAASDDLHQELPHWSRQDRPAPADLPVDHPDGVNSVPSTRSVELLLDAETTATLLTHVPHVYNTQINDILLTALAQTLNEWSGGESLLVEMAGHGREDIFDDVNLSRTVGWLSSRYPLQLDLHGVSDHGEAIKSVKEQIRRIPNRGIGYGILRYLTGGDISRQLRALRQPQVVFNYFGQFDELFIEPSPFALTEENRQRGVGLSLMRTDGWGSGLPGIRRYDLEVNSNTADGRLRVEWRYSQNLHDRSTVERLASRFFDNLRSLVTHCTSLEENAFTPSDFPLANFSQGQLDSLMAKLGGNKRDE